MPWRRGGWRVAAYGLAAFLGVAYRMAIAWRRPAGVEIEYYSGLLPARLP